MTKGTDSWSLSELVHAIVLLAHFHSLSSFVFSCGINEELDLVANCQGKENIQANSNNVSSAKENMVKSPKKISSSDSTTGKNNFINVYLKLFYKIPAQINAVK